LRPLQVGFCADPAIVENLDTTAAGVSTEAAAPVDAA
jgi:hypothetical protein